MSDEPKKPTEEHEAVVARYQRRGGSARKDDPRPGIWQRMVDWVTPPGSAPPGSIPPVQRSVTGQSPAASTAETVESPATTALPPARAASTHDPLPPRRSPLPERLALELLMPNGSQLLLLVRTPQEPGGGILQLKIEPAPGNDPSLIEGLSALGRGQEAAGQNEQEPHAGRRSLDPPAPPLPGLDPSVARAPAPPAPAPDELEAPLADAPMSPPSMSPPTIRPDLAQAPAEEASRKLPPLIIPEAQSSPPALFDTPEDMLSIPSFAEAPALGEGPLGNPPRQRPLDKLPSIQLPPPTEAEPFQDDFLSPAEEEGPEPTIADSLFPDTAEVLSPREEAPEDLHLEPPPDILDDGDLTLAGMGQRHSPPPDLSSAASDVEPARGPPVRKSQVSRGGAAAEVDTDLVRKPRRKRTPGRVESTLSEIATSGDTPLSLDQKQEAITDLKATLQGVSKPGASPPTIDPSVPTLEPAGVALDGERTNPRARYQELAAAAFEAEPEPGDSATPRAPDGPGLGYGEPARQPPSPTKPDLPPVPRREAPEPEPSPPVAPEMETPRSHPGFSNSMLPIVGIDFGTSYSSIAVMRAGLEVIPDEHGNISMPTVISFPSPGEMLIGDEARQRMAGAAQFTIVSPKRLLGRLYKDPKVSHLIGGLAFRTFAGTDKFIRFEAHGEIYSVTDICAMILARLRERACRYLNAEVSKAVFSVPVGFGTLQRSALEVAARKAGLEVSSLLTEPSAAVLSHGFRDQRGLVAVYDFGGGTFDFSVLQVTETSFQVLCAGGDAWLGGDDFDNSVANHLADRFWKSSGVDLRNRTVEWQSLLFACEAAKRALSTKSAAEVRIDDLLHTAKGSKGLRYKINRKTFNKLTEQLVQKSVMICDQVMGQAGISPQQVDNVVLTGGTSMIPSIREAMTKFFGKRPVEGDPDLAVVRGASLRAAELSGEAVAETSMGGRTLREVAGRTIGAGPKGGRVVTLFERDTPLPAEVFKAFYTQVDNQREMVIGLYEGTKSRVDESRTIGHLRYKGMHPAPAGQARIDFTFYLDEDGILHVTAIVEGKEYSKSIRLT